MRILIMFYFHVASTVVFLHKRGKKAGEKSLLIILRLFIFMVGIFLC